jgi:hypothetical protein
VFDKHTVGEAAEESLEDYEAEEPEEVFELHDGEEEAEGGDDGAEEEGLVLEDDEEAPESSLDELLARRAVQDGLEDEDAELFDLLPPSEKLASVGRGARPERAPSQEFVCMRCRLVKARAQLSDATRSLCRDCA